MFQTKFYDSANIIFDLWKKIKWEIWQKDSEIWRKESFLQTFALWT